MDSETRSKIIIQAKDEATEEVRNLTAALKENTATLQQAKEKTEDAAKSNKGFNLSIQDVAAGIYVAKNAAAMLSQIYDQTIAPTLALADAQRDLARSAGISAEQAGVMIQVADDLQINQSELSLAFRALNKDGIQPTFANIKKLAEQYQAIPDPVERAQFAFDKFGRSGEAMQKILERDVRELDDMAKSAKASGLVMSNESVAAARKFEASLDDLGDSVEGFKTKIFGDFIPPLIQATDAMTNFANVQMLTVDAVKSGAVGIEESSGLYQQFALGLETDAQAAEYFTRKLADQNDVQQKAALAADRAAYIQEIAAEKTKKASEYLDQYKMSAEDAAAMAKHFAGAVEDQAQKLDELQLLLAGPVGKENDTYQQKQKDLGAQIAETRDRIAELEQRQYLTATQKTELDDLQITLGTLKDQYKENADEHELATRRIVFNILEQRLAADGWKDEEVKLLGEVGEKWGLFDKDTKKALEGVNQALKDFHDGDGIKQAIVDLSILFGFPSEKTYTIKVAYQGGGMAGEAGLGGDAPVIVNPGNDNTTLNGAQGGYAEGGSFTVPGVGIADRPYTVNLKPGEEVNVTPTQNLGQSGTPTVINIYNTISNTADAEFLARRVAELVAQ